MTEESKIIEIDIFTCFQLSLVFSSGMMIVIETDHNAYTEDTKSQRKIQMAEEMREAAGEDEQVRSS